MYFNCYKLKQRLKPNQKKVLKVESLNNTFIEIVLRTFRTRDIPNIRLLFGTWSIFVE